ncbi:aquaporin [Demequina muriae]|uniref:MIP/aquaporin family protein n=1 Tax=Demequina muriae TaxID=3051664 RepID=A0ABT8GJV5_9MICO|nr:MIP/aquaporin family protein [Demequina sp. EGI L300058]MDN4481718.1 MIP/aquaporin family protein [Demequina sp. EGI L300058]
MNERSRKLLGEFVGSAGLAAAVIGSGIMAATLSPSDVGLQLLQNSYATALALAVLIAVLGPVSGAHFNPAVSLAERVLDPGARPMRETGLYIAVQIAGCSAGAILANLMFDLAPVALSTTDRADAARLLAEVIATAGLVGVIFMLVRAGRTALVAPAVGAYIGAAYYFTSSTSFANPAITVGRMLSDTFAGIAPGSVLPFVAAQLLGAALGVVAVRLLAPASALPTSGKVTQGT